MSTPRDRWQAMFAGEPQILCDYWGTAEVTARLLRELGCTSERALWERLGIDKLVLLGPTHSLAKEDTWHTPSMWSLWHVEVTSISYGDGLGTYEEAASNPLAKAETAADVERFDWPDPTLFDVDGLRAQCAALAGLSHSRRNLRTVLRLLPAARHGAGAYRPRHEPRRRGSGA